jgi:hypothetical protein
MTPYNLSRPSPAEFIPGYFWPGNPSSQEAEWVSFLGALPGQPILLPSFRPSQSRLHYLPVSLEIWMTGADGRHSTVAPITIDFH